MILTFFGRHLIWSRQSGNSTTELYYYDVYTWIVGAMLLAWLTWILVRRYRLLRRMRRPERRANHKSLNRVVKLKRELSSSYLRPGFSTNIHAVGIGMVGGDYCIHVFINDVKDEMRAASGTAGIPADYRGVPVRLVEMPAAGFLSEPSPGLIKPWEQYPNGIREHQEVIIGGISGANTNLTGSSGTIGYFCTRKSKFRRRKEIYLLSNSHVFADLRKTKVDEGDLILQPSPGEPANNRPIGTLVNFSALKFDGPLSEPNHIDAAIARLWGPQQHKALIPLIGSVKGYVEKKAVKIDEVVRKFGRTTGYTEGRVFSIYLDIWIKYDRTGQAAFFRDQILIEPTLPQFTRFAAKGDSGSLVVDAQQYAIGLIFGGVSEVPDAVSRFPKDVGVDGTDPAADKPIRIETYGVANPISEVLDRLKIDLLV